MKFDYSRFSWGRATWEACRGKWVNPVFLLGYYGCIFHGTGNLAQICQNFGISGAGVDRPVQPSLGTPLTSRVGFYNCIHTHRRSQTLCGLQLTRAQRSDSPCIPAHMARAINTRSDQCHVDLLKQSINSYRVTESIWLNLQRIPQSGRRDREKKSMSINHIAITSISYTSVSQPLWDRGPVNNFFYKTRARGPTNLLVNSFLIFFKFIH
jgi:hypothetical protein